MKKILCLFIINSFLNFNAFENNIFSRVFFSPSVMLELKKLSHLFLQYIYITADYTYSKHTDCATYSHLQPYVNKIQSFWCGKLFCTGAGVVYNLLGHSTSALFLIVVIPIRLF